jgi:hypothetical protein
VGADPAGGQHQLEHDGLVVEHQRDDAAGADSERVQGNRGALATRAEHPGWLGPAVEVNCRAHRFASLDSINKDIPGVASTAS